MYYSSSSLLALVAAVSSVSAHGVILKAVGDKGQSQGFLVDQTLARNCTTISPCQQDTVIIRDAEITANIVNECGRTEISGNIDVGAETENELVAGRMTQVKAGGTIDVTIHQVNADGAGPYTCDLDQTNNAGPAGNIPLKVTDNVEGVNGLSTNKEKDFTIKVQMPKDMNCIGASTGDICTVRCRNNALAGPFGGCFAVQQIGGQGRTNDSASAVEAAQTLQGISAQVLQNQKDLPVAIAANEAAGAAGGGDAAAGAAAISSLLAFNPGVAATSSAAAGKATAGAGAGNNNNQNGGNGKNNGNGKGNAGNGQAGNQNANGKGNVANGGQQAAPGGQQAAPGGQQQAGGNGKGNNRNQGNKLRRSAKFLLRNLA